MTKKPSEGSYGWNYNCKGGRVSARWKLTDALRSMFRADRAKGREHAVLSSQLINYNPQGRTVGKLRSPTRAPVNMFWRCPHGCGRHTKNVPLHCAKLAPDCPVSGGTGSARRRSVFPAAERRPDRGKSRGRSASCR
jgi:hypothetical protein